MIERICQQCKVKFFVWPSTVRRGEGKYCSRECSNNAQKRRVGRICQLEGCDNKFSVRLSKATDSRGKYCSQKCKGIAHSVKYRGANHPIWSGGPNQQKIDARTAVNVAIRSGSLVRGTCEHLECTEKKTHGHHDNYSNPLDVRWFCAKHHGEVHTKLRKASVMPTQNPA